MRDTSVSRVRRCESRAGKASGVRRNGKRRGKRFGLLHVLFSGVVWLAEVGEMWVIIVRYVKTSVSIFSTPWTILKIQKNA